MISKLYGNRVNAVKLSENFLMVEYFHYESSLSFILEDGIQDCNFGRTRVCQFNPYSYVTSVARKDLYKDSDKYYILDNNNLDIALKISFLEQELLNLLNDNKVAKQSSINPVYPREKVDSYSINKLIEKFDEGQFLAIYQGDAWYQVLRKDENTKKKYSFYVLINGKEELINISKLYYSFDFKDAIEATNNSDLIDQKIKENAQFKQEQINSVKTKSESLYKEIEFYKKDFISKSKEVRLHNLERDFYPSFSTKVLAPESGLLKNAEEDFNTVITMIDKIVKRNKEDLTDSFYEGIDVFNLVNILSKKVNLTEREINKSFVGLNVSQENKVDINSLTECIRHNRKLLFYIESYYYSL